MGAGKTVTGIITIEGVYNRYAEAIHTFPDEEIEQYESAVKEIFGIPIGETFNFSINDHSFRFVKMADIHMGSKVVGCLYKSDQNEAIQFIILY